MTAASVDATGGCGLLLLAHGARERRWAEPFEAVAARVRAARPGAAVQLAYLELMTPTLPEAAAALAAAGCRRIVVLPLFLGRGAHLSRDLPQQVQALQQAHPQLRFRLQAAAGEHAALVAAMTVVAAEALDLAAGER